MSRVKNRFKLHDRADSQLEAKNVVKEGVKLRGRYMVEHRRARHDAEGNLIPKVPGTQVLDGLGNPIPGTYEMEEYADLFPVENSAVNVGLNKLLDVMFNGTAAITTWYCGLVDNAAFSAFAAADTMGSHAGWAEGVPYSNANRITWGSGAAASQSVTNAAAMTFNINATATVYGLFITSNNTKSGTTGTLWSTAAFAATRSVVSGDTLNLTYTLSAA